MSEALINEGVTEVLRSLLGDTEKNPGGLILREDRLPEIQAALWQTLAGIENLTEVAKRALYMENQLDAIRWIVKP